GRGSGHGDSAVNARVEPDHRNLGRLGFFQQRHNGFAVEGGQTHRVGLLVQGGLEHLDLLVDLRLALGAFEGDLDVEVLGGIFRAELDGLPELMLEAFGNNRDVGGAADLGGGRASAGWRGRSGRRRGGRTGTAADDDDETQARNAAEKPHWRHGRHVLPGVIALTYAY